MRILIVDDEPNWIRFHINNLKYLNLTNLKIDTANSAYDGLAKIEVSIDDPYDVILTDLQMESNFLPKLAGEWLIEQIHMFDEYKNAKITILSGASSIGSIAKKHGVNYIPKSKLINSEAKIYKTCLP